FSCHSERSFSGHSERSEETASLRLAPQFFRRFGVPEQSLGILFFAVHLLNAGSHLGVAGEDDRPAEHAGVHAFALRPIPDCRALRTLHETCDCVVFCCAKRSWRWMCPRASPMSPLWLVPRSAPLTAGSPTSPKMFAGRVVLPWPGCSWRAYLSPRRWSPAEA